MSKNSYSASNPWKENVKQKLWVIALCCLYPFFQYIVAAASINTAFNYMYTNDYVKSYLDITSVSENGIAVFFYAILGFIVGISSFSYLFNERETTFYHSLPIKRTKLYLINVVNSILIVAVPALIMSEIGAVIIGTAHGKLLTLVTGTLVNTLAQLLFFTVSLLASVIAVMLTGNIGTSIAASLVFLGYCPAVSYVYYQLVLLFKSTINTYYSFIGSIRFSPYLLGFASIMESSDKGNKYTSFMTEAIILAVALFILGLFLYLKRPSEAAGHSMVFNCTKGPIKVLITIPVGLLFAFIFGSIFGSNRHPVSGWNYFGITVGFLLSYAIMEIVYNSDFKKLFSHKITLFVSLAATYFIYSIFAMDLFHYDTYLPAENAVKSASIASNQLEFEYNAYADGDSSGIIYSFNNYYNGYVDRFEKYALISLNTTEFTDIKDIREIAKLGVENVKKARQDDHFKYDEGTSTVYIKWNLKNGRSVLKKYVIERSRIAQYCENIYNSSDYLTGKYKIMGENAGDISQINVYNGESTYKLNNLTDAEKQEIIDSYRKELSSMSYKDKENARFAGMIQFRNSKDEIKYNHMKSWMFDTDSIFNVCPLYRNMTETLALLSKYHYRISEIDPDSIDSVTINIDDYADSEDSSTYSDDYTVTNIEGGGTVITDKEKIKEILDHSDTTQFAINNIYEPYYNITVNSSTDTDSYQLFILADEVPDFLKSMRTKN